MLYNIIDVCFTIGMHLKRHVIKRLSNKLRQSLLYLRNFFHSLLSVIGKYLL